MCPSRTFSQTARVIAHLFISLILPVAGITFFAPNAGAVSPDSLSAPLDSLQAELDSLMNVARRL